MLYQTVSQPKIFLIFSLFGFLCGIFFNIRNMLHIKKYVIFRHFFDFFATFITLFIFFILNVKFNFGEFRFFLLISFLLSFTIGNFITTNFLAKPVSNCYNKLRGKRNENQKRTKV